MTATGEIRLEKKTVIIAVVLVALAVVGASLFVIFQNDDKSKDARVNIDGDHDLIEQAEDRGWPGDGTAANPYIISGLEMNLTGDDPGISLRNITVHVSITGCEISHHLADDGSVEGIGIDLFDVSNVSVTNNHISSIGTCLRVWNCSEDAVVNNTMEGSSVTIHIFRSDSITVANNHFSGQGLNALDSSSGCSINSNTFIRTEGMGLFVWNASHNAFNDNLFKGTPLGAGGTRGFAGMTMTASDNNTFENDQMIGGGYYGIGASMSGSDGNHMTDCTMSGRIGIEMIASNDNDILNSSIWRSVVIGIEMNDCSRNRITGNMLNSSFSETGIKMAGCDENTVSLNNITGHVNSAFLIYLNESAENSIFGNIFRYTGELARDYTLALDDSSTNHWNSTGTGNYWSDWTSPDSNSDGIVDVPYEIDGGAGATDWYPVTNPNFQV